jgi:hypothetical protein
MTTKWIDEQPGYEVGSKAFLIMFSYENTGAEHYVLRDQPAYTNVSREPRLTGWCGTYNNLGTHGEGAWEVIRIAKSGRLLIQQLGGDALNEFLEEMGYPELAP